MAITRWAEIKKKYKIYSTRKYNSIKRIYSSPAEFEAKVRAEPYHMIHEYLDKPFKNADALILELFPGLRSSAERCRWCCLYLLKQNEAKGHTKLNASILFNQMSQNYPELIDYVYEAVTTWDRIYYDKSSKATSIASTYYNESLIAEEIKNRINNPVIDDMDWQKYRNIDDIELTNEQMSLLKSVCNNSVVMLNGSAGCVDCDTEFFNGQGWKRIADYQVGDKVLQYNNDGTATLVEPLAYIKLPCSHLWHFETPHSINQTVCEEHRVLYKWSEDSKIQETNVLALKEKSDSNINWNGKFITQFYHYGNGMCLSDEEIRVMVAVMAEGHFDTKYSGSKTKWCTVRLKKERKINRLELLLNRANIDYKKQVDQFGVTIIRFYAPERRKIYGGDWWNANKRQAKIIYEEVTHWDGEIIKSRVNNKEKPCFRTTEKQSADYIQYIFIVNGWQATIVNNKNAPSRKDVAKIVYKVTTKHNKFSSLCFDTRPEKTKTQFVKVASADGYKYCFNVPSHMLVLRRCDCVFITGNCGKTSVVRALTQMLDDNARTYTMLAPTGIAAKRLSQVTHRDASTIHRFLASGHAMGEYLILEESSMVGVNLLGLLFTNLPKKTKIILICDEAQLASISCGNIVKDIIDSGIVPIVNLTHVFRYGTSGLATIATDIRTGKEISANTEFDDYSFIQIDKKPINDVLNVYAELLKTYKRDDILILSPFNVKELGTYVINKSIQDKYNSNPTLTSYTRQSVEIDFKADDIIVNTENNYHMMGENFSDIPVMNGDVGKVLGYDELSGLLEVQFESGIAYLEKGDIYKQLLGYCLTVHKVQGMQAKAVIVVIDKSHGFFLTRNLCYVAMSRAQEKLVVIGDIDTINESLKIQEEKRRNTWLKELLVNGN